MDDDEVKWLIARELPRLRRYARSLGRDAASADDLVQDCLERALRKRHLWQRRGSVRGWLLRILYRVHLNGRSAARETTPIELVDPGERALVEAPRQMLRIELREVAEALDLLPDEQRATLMLVALEGLSYDEAALVLDVPVGTVRSRLSRARAALALRRQQRPARGHLRRVK